MKGRRERKRERERERERERGGGEGEKMRGSERLLMRQEYKRRTEVIFAFLAKLIYLPSIPSHTNTHTHTHTARFCLTTVINDCAY